MAIEASTPQQIPVRIEFEYPERMSRWLLWVKWLLVIPHLIVLYIYGFLVNVTTLIAWFAILFTGRYPRGLFEFAVGYFRWSLRVQAYFPLLMTDRYPPFGEGEHPVRLEVDYPDQASRGVLMLRLLMLVPLFPFIWLFLFGAYYLLLPVVIVFYAVLSWVWLSLLCTAEYPRGLYNLMANLVGWQFRVTAWLFLFRDDWSLFGTKGVRVVDVSAMP